jgi:transcriptional regulator GlxA family with amidase domain
MYEAKKDTMRRREFLSASAALGMMAAVPFAFPDRFGTPPGFDGILECAQENKPAAASNPVPTALKPPAHGSVPVAFVISDGAVIIDFCGPWEVFESVSVPGTMDDAFHLYTVAETTSPIRASGGMKIVPNYTFETAPAPKVILIPAQNGASDAMVEWIRRSSKNADVTMSVCTGAFVLARTGLLSGKSATTHHSAYRTLAMKYPDIHVKRGARYVEEGNLATAGGLSSGIDLALRVVERYYGHEVAVNTAYQLEYQGQGWMDPNSNAVYAKARVSTAEHPLCPVCEMDVDVATAPTSVYKGKTYYFCMQSHKEMFDAAPDKFI